ncbi:molybdopterin molybdotransferase [Propionibacterium cyclohexanicum]|uniref:Molybdopterin molybdenumtransferase n=1 Tax=Propionibacterium cyclohexanicum TaxID=64702 RepID=A0A1H9U445_9ACTN|nr:gephyrin-like molybdotransferase Glp [Propionibacterium cyclohexanicum]SES04092.1 molybdopterin molybdotransferase [Propionibacterium cyclohexanicum]
MALFGHKRSPAPPPAPEPEPTLPAAPEPGPLGLRTVDDQRDYLLSMVEPLMPFGMRLLDAWGLSLCEDLTAEGDLPAVPEAECDGYAVIATDLEEPSATSATKLAIRSDVHKVGAAVPVLAGQPLPEGADAVLPLTDGTADSGVLLVRRAVRSGEHVRAVGADAADGEVLVESGRRLDARIIGLLAGAGFDKVFCRPRPRVVVLAVGESRPGVGVVELDAAQRRDAASHMIAAAAKADGAQVWREVIPGDDPAAVAETVSDQLIRADLLVACGGMAGGPEGLMGQALAGLGPVEFTDVAMAPGGQQGFGLIGQDQIPLLMLPSAPTAAYAAYQVFGRAMVRKLMGARHVVPELISCILDAPVTSQDGVFELVPGRLRREAEALHVRPLSGAGGLDVLTDADVLIAVPGDVTGLAAGRVAHCWRAAD